MLRGGTYGLIGVAIQHLVEAAFRLSRTSTNNGTFKLSSIYSPGAPTSAEGGISSRGAPIDVEGRLIGAGFVPHRGAHRCRAVAYKDDIYVEACLASKFAIEALTCHTPPCRGVTTLVSLAVWSLDD